MLVFAKNIPTTTKKCEGVDHFGKLSEQFPLTSYIYFCLLLSFFPCLGMLPNKETVNQQYHCHFFFQRSP